MNKLIALVVASTFAFGAASSFAAATTSNHESPMHQGVVSHQKSSKATFQKVRYNKKVHHRHHVKRHQHQR